MSLSLSHTNVSFLLLSSFQVLIKHDIIIIIFVRCLAFVRGAANLYTSGLCMLLFTHKKGPWTRSADILLFFMLFNFVFSSFVRVLLISS